MNLDSARDLKFSLREKLLAKPPMARSLSAARTLGAWPEPAPTLALGIVRRKANDFALAVRIQQRELQHSRELELIRKQAGSEIDERYIGQVRKRSVPWHRQRQRPLRIGVSVGHSKITAGTLGAFVRPRDGGPLALLSNNHVLANENRAKKGDAILQPGKHDGGNLPDDTVAHLADFIRIKGVGPNFVDAAIATVVDDIAVDLTKLTGLGKLKGVGDVFLDEGTNVSKLGRTTGKTHGRVTAFELDEVFVEFDNPSLRSARFDGQIEIEGDGDLPFSAGGDSGSLIVGEDRRGVALLFAGSDQGGENGQGLTYANPLHPVLDALKIDLAL